MYMGDVVMRVNSKKGSVLRGIIYVTLIGIIVFLLVYIYFLDNPNQNEYVSKQIGTQSDNIQLPNIDNVVIDQENQTDVTNIFDNTIKTIVGITVLTMDANSLIENNVSNSLNMGSGIIVSNKGYILTNQHVAGNQNDVVYVTLSDGNVYLGTTKWSDTVLDLAIVKIEANNLAVAKLGDSDSLKLGQNAYAIGNPLGLDFQRTITSGIISALNRTIKINDSAGIGYMENLIQTDASINPGNSGGALINQEGEVIGINTVKVAEAEGIGFAIPINTVKNIIQQFEEYDEFEEAYLGIFAYDNILLSLNNARTTVDKGILVANIDRFGPLANSNIQLGNILLSIDNVNLSNMVELRKYLYTKTPNDTVVIKYMDENGNSYKEKIVLGKKI